MNNNKPSLQEYLSLKYIAGGHPLTQILSQRLGAIIAWLCQSLGFSPNAVTVLAGIVISIAAFCYAYLGDASSNIILVILLLQLAYAADCADGQLARGTGRTSKIGAWLDVMIDFYAIGVISVALLIVLIEQSNEPLISILAVSFFTISRNISLFSSTVARKSSENSHGSTASAAGAIRTTFRIMIDTSTILFFLAILRPYEYILISYLIFMTILLTTHSVFIGKQIKSN